MKIAVFHELHQGGARRSVNEFAYHLKKSNIVDLYIVDNKKNIEEKHSFSSIFFYPFKDISWQGKNWKKKLYKDTLELIRLFRLHSSIAKDINARKYDIVIVHPSKFTQAPFILTFLNKTPIYYCHEALRMVYENELDIPANIHPLKRLYERCNRRIRKAIDKRNISFAHTIITNSKFTQKNIKNIYNRESIVCYEGVNASTFRPVKNKKNIDILFIGEKGNMDGYDLLDRAKELMEGKWQIYIHSFNEWISDTKLVKLYADAKVCLCLARNEPFGLVPLEAMACGTPVIAVAEGGYKETVKHKHTGILIRRDPRELVAAVNHVMSNAKTRKLYGLNSRKYVEKFWTWDIATENLEKVLRKLI